MQFEVKTLCPQFFCLHDTKQTLVLLLEVLFVDGVVQWVPCSTVAFMLAL